MGKTWGGTSPNKGYRNGKKYMRRHSVTFVSREIQIKILIQFHYIPTKIVKVLKTENTNSKNVELTDSSDTTKQWLAVATKVKHIPTQRSSTSASRCVPKRDAYGKTCMHHQTCTVTQPN